MSVRRNLAFVVDAGPVFLLFGLLQANRRLRYLLPKNAKLQICFSPEITLRDTFRSCKTIKRAQLSLIASYS